MIEELFQEQRKAIDYFFDKLNHEETANFLQRIVNTKGIVIFSGVGKSGLVAEKIALTLTSTGTRAVFFQPTNFLHGDLGFIESQDTLVLISKSGRTEELLSLIPLARRRGASLLTIVCDGLSPLATLADAHVLLPLERELCPFGSSPTTSTSLQMIFGDVLSVALMHSKGFTREAYALNHPSGTIGRKMSMKVSDLMLEGERLPLCSGNETLGEILERLTQKKCGCILVTGEKRELLGIFTDGDLRRSLQIKDVMLRPMKSLMTCSVKTLSKELLATEALSIMESDNQKRVAMMPVVEGEKVVGLLTMHDIVTAGLHA